MIKIFAIATAFLVYLFASPMPLHKELTLLPTWCTKIEADSETRLDDGTDRSVSYQMGRRFGYVTDGGTIIAVNSLDSLVAVPKINESGKQSSDYDVIVSDEAYAVFQRGGTRVPTEEVESCSFKAPGGSLLFSVNDNRLPFIRAGRLFSVSAGLATLREYDKGGVPLWNFDFSSIITAFDVSKTLVVAGLLNGRVEGVDARGKPILSFEAGGSRIPVIVGIAASPAGDAVAIVSGIDRQRFIYLVKKGSEFRVAFHKYLDSDFRSSIAVRFSDDGLYVFYAQPRGIAIFDTETKSETMLPVLATHFEIFSETKHGLVLVSAETAGGTKLLCVDPPSRVLFSHEIVGRESFARLYGGNLFVGDGDRIARLDIAED